MKLKVGEIELDSGAPALASPPAAQRASSQASPRRSALDHQRLVVVVTLVGAAFITGAQVLLGRLPVWGLLISLGALVGLCVALPVMGRAKQAQAPPPNDEASSAPAALCEERARRVLCAVEAMGPTGASFRELERALGWVEPVLAQTLSAMVAADQIEEALDLETGHWSYKISQQVRFGWDEQEDDASVSLAQRLERTLR